MKFSIQTLETAPEASREALTAIADKYGFVPNLAGVFATSPGALHGLLGALAAFDGPGFSLDPVERQVVLLTTSVLNRCAYCTAAHTMVAVKSGLDESEARRLQGGGALSDRRLDALRHFTQVVVESRGFPTADDLHAFATAGFDNAAVLEVLFGVALKTLTNYANHIAKPEVNEQFAAFLPDWQEAA